MKLTIQPTYTVNVGDAGATASSEITFEVFESVPKTFKLGHLRMRPTQVVNSGINATIEYFDANGRGFDWKRVPATILDVQLAASIVQESSIDSSQIVYYEYIIRQPGE